MQSYMCLYMNYLRFPLQVAEVVMSIKLMNGLAARMMMAVHLWSRLIIVYICQLGKGIWCVIFH